MAARQMYVDQMCSCTFDLLWAVSCYVQCRRQIFDCKRYQLAILNINLPRMWRPSVSKGHGVTSVALERLQPREQRFVLVPRRNLRERANVGDFLERFSFHLKICACVNFSRFDVHMP